jgi:hypothetical protein
MSHTNAPSTTATDRAVPQANPIDVAEQSHAVDLDSVIEDYPWVRRDEVLTIGGRRFFI